MQVFSVHKTKLSFKNSCMDTVFPNMLILLLFKRERLPACVLLPSARHTQELPCQLCQRRVLLLLGSVQRVLVSFQALI